MDLQWTNLNLEDVVQNAESNRFSQSTTFKLTFSFWFFCKQLRLDYSDSWTSILIRILLMKPFLISSETKHNLQLSPRISENDEIPCTLWFKSCRYQTLYIWIEIKHRSVYSSDGRLQLRQWRVMVAIYVTKIPKLKTTEFDIDKISI